MSGDGVSTRSVPGVLFVEDFDDLSPFQAGVPSPAGPVAQTPVVDVAVETPDPDSAESHLRHLLAEARDEGFAEGYRSAEEGIVGERVALLRRIESSLDQAGQVFREAIDADIERLAGVCLSLLLECFPALCDRHGHDELTRMLRTILPTLTDEAVLKIAVSRLDEHAAREEAACLLAAGCRVSIAVAGDMIRGDVRLTWDNGTAVRDIRRARDDLLGRLQSQGLLHEANEEAAL